MKEGNHLAEGSDGSSNNNSSTISSNCNKSLSGNGTINTGLPRASNRPGVILNNGESSSGGSTTTTNTNTNTNTNANTNTNTTAATTNANTTAISGGGNEVEGTTLTQRHKRPVPQQPTRHRQRRPSSTPFVGFSVTPDELHSIVADREEGLKVARGLGGVAGIAKALHVDMRSGRSDGTELEAARVATFGRNKLPPPPEVTFLDLVIDSLKDPMMTLLVGAAVLSLILGLTVPNPRTGEVDYSSGWVEGAAILISVAIVTLVTSLNNYQKEQKFKEISEFETVSTVSVTRHGKVTEVSGSELLVGDLIHVVAGMVLPADGIVARSSGLKMDESGATGENDEIEKRVDGDFVLRSGSNVLEGEAAVMVTGVGINSFSGRITMECRTEKADTPLQEQLSELAEQIGHLGMAAAALMFVVLSIKELVFVFYYETRALDYKKFLDMITISITIVVVAVPEGLPLSVTIALAYSMKQMLLENNLVRHLAACETMGGATTICTDKTGTLTQNVMTVMQGFVGDHYFQLTGGKAKDAAEIEKITRHRELMNLLAESISLNSTATKRRGELSSSVAASNAAAAAAANTTAGNNAPFPAALPALKYVGNKTEQALLMFLERAGSDPAVIKARYDPCDLRTFPFTSAKKRMVTAVQLDPATVRYHVKGASEMVLAACASVHTGSRIQTLTRGHKQDILTIITQMARNRLRTISIAYADVHVDNSTRPGAGPPIDGAEGNTNGTSTSTTTTTTTTTNNNNSSSSSGCNGAIGDETASSSPVASPLAHSPSTTTTTTTTGQRIDGSGPLLPVSDDELPPLCLLGVIGIEDPIRPEVEDSVNSCKRAGVFVRMVTGDNKATAISIAKKAGIYGTVYSGAAKGEQGLAMEGHVFREVAKSPKKLSGILSRLQVLSRASPLDKTTLVAALMDRGEVVAVTGDGTNDAPALKNANVGFAMNSGTDVAKKASDVVILDDNFRSIVTAMKWGRNVHDNIAKFIQFQTTVNVTAVTISFIGAALSANTESPLKPVQLLWLNLIMDTMAALALATEKPHEEVLWRPPRGRSAPLISRRMWLNILGQAVYQIILQLWILHYGYRYFVVQKESREHLTIVFNIFVLLQVANEFNARILDSKLNVFSGLVNAPLFLAVIAVTLVVQYVSLTFGGKIMHTVPLTLAQHKKCIVLSLVPLLIGVLLRLIPIKEKQHPEQDFVLRGDKKTSGLGGGKGKAQKGSADEDGKVSAEEEEEEESKNRPKMTFRRAVYCIIAQLKIVNFIAEPQECSKFL